MARKATCGLIGFGTVGSGVYALLEKNAALIEQRTGVAVSITAICDLRTDEVRKRTAGVAVTGDWRQVVDDPEIDTVIELIGGLDPAKAIVLAALERGKNVVTANKKLLAEDGGEIFARARTKPAGLGFEAAVGGGIPCILSLRSGLVGNRVSTVMGILNGTTNYILTQMTDGGLSFDAALAIAQQKGFAEADPTFDVEGFDAGHKIAILSMLAFGRSVDYRAVPMEGITKIRDIDIAYAREMGYVIKLLGIGKLVGGEIDIRVHPTMLPARHPLAAVRNEFNAVLLEGDMTGPVVLYGRGAGGAPTASAIVSDIIAIASNGPGAAAAPAPAGGASVIGPEKRLSRYYLRLTTQDRPGILAQIAGALGRCGISIASVIQREGSAEYVPLVIMTHAAGEDRLQEALGEINTYPFVRDAAMMIRVEDADALGESHE
ncbi:MAG TPA: homoserine dehydrogenase [Spirochaetota bacterium]|nr:homoserine dehydrogenase [Spirochaetota bacterium]HPI23876.1 homoserine dehydrogenase [Spirochaetota bacterium]HPU87299.1 homoserine dehydrogenase [Spirochaetota bacterium]